MNDLQTRITNAVKSKPDVMEVVTHLRESGLSNDPEQDLTNAVGNYYRAKVNLLEKKLKEAEATAGKTDKPLKKKSGENDRHQRLNDIPRVSGSKGARSAGVSTPDDLISTMQARRKARGIGEGGRIR